MQQRTNTHSQSSRQAIYVGLVLAVAVLVSALLFWLRPAAEKQPVRDRPPLAEFVVARSESLSIPVFSRGTIKPSRQIKLVAEVSGRIAQINQSSFNGEVFSKDDLLLRIDDTDYRLAATQAEARVAAAEQQLARVQAEARQARFDLQQIGRETSEVSDYALRKPHVAEARANLRAARAELEMARLQLARTRLLAPFDGRMISHSVDVGQYVSVGTVLGEIYAIEAAEVSLPVSLSQIELLGISLSDMEQNRSKVSAQLNTDYAGKKIYWDAQLSHVDSELDERNRLVNVVVRIEQPLNVENQQRPPLTPGMFVRAQLNGIAKQNVIRLPREALRGINEVWLITGEEQLEKRRVELYTKDKQSVYISAGLQPGERVIVNAIDYVVDGMSLSANDVSRRYQSGEMK